MIKWAIKDFLDEREYRQVSKNTLANYQTLFKDFHTYCLEHEIIETSEVTQAVIKSYLLYCQRERHNSPTSLNTKLTALKTLFNYLEETGEISSKNNPTKKMKYVKAELNLTTFNDAQIKEMLKYCKRLITECLLS